MQKTTARRLKKLEARAQRKPERRVYVLQAGESLPADVNPAHHFIIRLAPAIQEQEQAHAKT